MWWARDGQAVLLNWYNIRKRDPAPGLTSSAEKENRNASKAVK
jgi:hypothetical protein